MAGKGQRVLTAGIMANRRGGSGSRNLRNSSQICKQCLVRGFIGLVTYGVAYLRWESTSSHLIGAVMVRRHVLLLNRHSASFITSFPTLWDRCGDELCGVCGVSSPLGCRSGAEGRYACAHSVTVNKSSLQLTVGRRLSGWETSHMHART